VTAAAGAGCTEPQLQHVQLSLMVLTVYGTQETSKAREKTATEDTLQLITDQVRGMARL
jgi:hypothetical protein